MNEETILDLRKEEDKLTQLKIKLKKAPFGCGRRFEFGDYINGALCTENCLCDNCEQHIEHLKTKIINKEQLILGFKSSKNEALVDNITKILNNTKLDDIERIQQIKVLING